jgi:hypothetical protein
MSQTYQTRLRVSPRQGTWYCWGLYLYLSGCWSAWPYLYLSRPYLYLSGRFSRGAISLLRFVWRHPPFLRDGSLGDVDVFHTIIDPLSRVSLLAYGISYLALIVIFTVVNPNEVPYGSFGEMLFMVLLAVIALAAARSIKAVRRQKLPVLNLDLIDLIKRTKSSAPKQGRTFFHARTSRAWRFLITGIGLSVLSPIISPISALIDIASVYFFLRARVEFQPKAEALLQSDPRSPVLFLRSFSEDERVSFKEAMTQETLFDVSLEDGLARHFSSTGPFIAVGSPGQAVPVLGAARASLSNAEWQSKVVDWMDSASLIIIVPGITHFVEWEFRQIVQRGHAGKLILLFRPLATICQIVFNWLRLLFSTLRGVPTWTILESPRICGA